MTRAGMGDSTSVTVLSLSGLHDPQDWMAVNVLQWKVHEMGSRVDGDRVRVRHMELAKLAKVVIALFEHRNRAGFCRDIQALQPWIKSEHVRIFADLMHGEEPQGIQIEHRERVILFAGNEREPILLIKRDAVRIPNARQLVSADDFHCCGIDRNEFVYSVNCNQNVTRS